VIQVEQHTAVHRIPAIAIEFKSEVIHEEISVDALCKCDHGRYHLDCRPDRIDDLCARVDPGVGLKDVICNNFEVMVWHYFFYIRAPDDLIGSGNDSCCGCILPDPDLYCGVVMRGDICPYALLNMFMLAHFKQIIAMHIHIFWDLAAPAGLQVPVGRTISAVLGVESGITENPVRMMGYDHARKQVNARVLLDSVQAYKHRHKISDPVLLVVSQDLFRDGHRFVFGLAREPVGAAVVSCARLGNEFYGKPAHDDDLIDRLSKEGAHELGHLLGLNHCAVPECIMFLPNSLDELDCKKKMFCDACSQELENRKQALPG